MSLINISTYETKKSYPKKGKKSIKKKKGWKKKEETTRIEVGSQSKYHYINQEWTIQEENHNKNQAYSIALGAKFNFTKWD